MTKDKICVLCLRLCRRASFLSSNLNSVSVVEIKVSRYPLSLRCVLNVVLSVVNCSFERSFLGVCPEKPKCAFNEALFDPRWVAT